MLCCFKINMSGRRSRSRSPASKSLIGQSRSSARSRSPIRKSRSSARSPSPIRKYRSSVRSPSPIRKSRSISPKDTKKLLLLQELRNDCFESIDPITLEDFNELNLDDLEHIVKIGKGPKKHCFKLDVIYKIIKQNPINPLTREPFTEEEIQIVLQAYFNKYNEIDNLKFQRKQLQTKITAFKNLEKRGLHAMIKKKFDETQLELKEVNRKIRNLRPQDYESPSELSPEET